MDYSTYTLEDFLADERFVNYCFETNEADVQYWENVLSEQPLLIEKINDAKALCMLLAVKTDVGEKKAALNRLEKAIDLRTTHMQRLSINTKRWLSIAASLLLLACVYMLVPRQPSSLKAIQYALKQQATQVLATTNIEERRQITLSDGSTVLLNGNSNISVTMDYNEAYRIVWLTGSAYFEVAEDKRKPFVVITSSSATTALGTAFRVTHYPNQHEPFVMLASGKVQVDQLDEGRGPVSSIHLSPGEKATLGEGSPIVKSAFEPDEMTAWLERRLEFQAAGFDEIKEKLYDIYGISLMADDAIANRISFTGQFVNSGLSEVLDAIAFSNRLGLEIDDDRIHLIE